MSGMNEEQIKAYLAGRDVDTVEIEPRRESVAIKLGFRRDQKLGIRYLELEVRPSTLKNPAFSPMEQVVVILNALDKAEVKK